MKLLKIPESRRQIYFGLDPTVDHIDKWVRKCNSIKTSREERNSARLRELQHIALRIELKRKFGDWHRYVVCRQLLNRSRLVRALRAWRQTWMTKRYIVLEALLSNGKRFLRKRFNAWHEATLLLRALSHRKVVLKRMVFRLWCMLWTRRRHNIAGKYFNLWRDWLIRIKTLQKLVGDIILRIHLLAILVLLSVPH